MLALSHIVVFASKLSSFLYGALESFNDVRGSYEILPPVIHRKIYLLNNICWCLSMKIVLYPRKTVTFVRGKKSMTDINKILSFFVIVVKLSFMITGNGKGILLKHCLIVVHLRRYHDFNQYCHILEHFSFLFFSITWHLLLFLEMFSVSAQINEVALSEQLLLFQVKKTDKCFDTILRMRITDGEVNIFQLCQNCLFLTFWSRVYI